MATAERTSRITRWLVTVTSAASADLALAVTPAQGAGASVTLAARAAGSGCPAGTVVFAPQGSPAALAADPHAAVPAGFGQVADTHLFRRALAQHVRWLSTIDCQAQPNVPTNHVVPSSAALKTQGSFNWSGYEETKGAITQVAEGWTVPAVHLPAGQQIAVMSIWPGIGPGTSKNAQLLQAGTAQSLCSQANNCGLPKTTAWFEAYPQESQENITNLPVEPGQAMGVIVTWKPAKKQVLFDVCNFDLGSQGTCAEVRQTIAGAAGTGAEWILERSTLCEGSNCFFPSLAKFGSVSFNSAEVNQGGVKAAENVANVRINMFSCQQGNPQIDQTSPFVAPKRYRVSWLKPGVTKRCS